MANEITVTQYMTCSRNGNVTRLWNPTGRKSFNQAGADNADSGTQTINTTITDITLTTVGTPGFLGIRNLDLTNYVDIGYDDSGTLRNLIRLYPQEYCNFRLVPGKTLAAQAISSSCIVEFLILEA